MGTRTVRLDEDVYEQIKSRKRDDETFSEAIERLTSDYTLLDFAEGEPVLPPEEHREAIEAIDERSKRDTEERLEKMNVDGGT